MTPDKSRGFKTSRANCTYSCVDKTARTVFYNRFYGTNQIHRFTINNGIYAKLQKNVIPSRFIIFLQPTALYNDVSADQAEYLDCRSGMENLQAAEGFLGGVHPQGIVLFCTIVVVHAISGDGGGCRAGVPSLPITASFFTFISYQVFLSLK